jgi:hypothetical protein
MENQSRELPPTTRGAFGPLHEVRGLQTNGAASVAELKEFLSSLRGKNPQEVIGIISSSMLIQSLGIAAAATAALLIVGTIGPYLVYGPPKPKVAATSTAPAINAKESADAKAAPAAEPARSDTPDAGKAAKVLGIDEVKESDPTKNPLDKGPDIDNLLDGVD